MRKSILAVSVLFAAGLAQAGETAHWGYSGEGAPENWGKLNPEFTTCATGRNQSPIDLAEFIEAELNPIHFHYTAGGGEVVNNGHTVQVNYAPGSKIMLDGRDFELKQFHFHAPSENHIAGKSFPMEGHLVHSDKDGMLAVVSVMFVEGNANHAIGAAWKQMPQQAGEKQALAAPVDAAAILPAQRDYYRFGGSLTTPPCTEGVTWLVMKEPVSVSKAQVEQFAETMQHPNNRPIQGVYNRPVLK